MDLRPRSLLELTRTPGGKKLMRYSVVSVISVLVSQIVLFVTFGVLRLWSAATSNVVAVCVSAVPSYYLNRNWAWGKSGRSHLFREVLPFWALALIGLGFSTWAVDLAHNHIHHIKSHLAVAVIINGASLASYGVLWIGKFMIFNELMFKHHPEDLEPALDGRTGLPT